MAHTKGLIWKTLVKMAKALWVHKQLAADPRGRRWVPPWAARTARGPATAAIAAGLRETSWRPCGAVWQPPPVRPWRWYEATAAVLGHHSAPRDVTAAGEGRCSPCTVPHVHAEGSRSVSWAARGLCSVLTQVPACHRGGSISFSRCGFAICNTRCGVQRCPQLPAFVLSSVRILAKSRNEYV